MRYMARQLGLFLWQALLLGAACALLLWLAAFLPADALAAAYAAYVWALCPLVGGFVTVRAVLKGMQPYLALWALPLVPALAQRLVTGTALDMAAVVAYALVGLICAATGDELLKRRRRGK